MTWLSVYAQFSDLLDQIFCLALENDCLCLWQAHICCYQTCVLSLDLCFRQIFWSICIAQSAKTEFIHSGYFCSTPEIHYYSEAQQWVIIRDAGLTDLLRCCGYSASACNAVNCYIVKVRHKEQEVIVKVIADLCSNCRFMYSEVLLTYDTRSQWNRNLL